MATSFDGGGLERSEVDGQRVPEHKVDVGATVQSVAERRFEPPVELDRVHVPHPVGEERREHAEPRPDLEHDIARRQIRKSLDHDEQVAIDQEVLAECLLRADGRHARPSPNARSAFSSMRRSSSDGCLLTLGREDGERVDHVGRLVAPTADGLRGQIGAVRLGQDPVGRDAGRRLPKSVGLRVRHVAGERDVVPPLERRIEQVGLREAVEDDRPGNGASAAAVSTLAARLWITTGSPSASASSRCASNSRRCSGSVSAP